MVCQVEGLNSIIKSGRAIVGGTRMGQGMQVNSGYQAILIVDIGGELSILGVLMASTHLLATMVVAASLS